MIEKLDIMKKFFIIYVLIYLFVACYDDMGNYDYHEISEVTIDSVKASYRVVSFKDTLQIKPEIKSTGNNERFEYLWTIYNSAEKDDEGIVITDTISREAELEFPVNLKAGDYTIVFKVQNAEDKRELYKTTFLHVETEFSRGFYVLKNMNGVGDMDLHLPESGMFENILSNSGVEISGEPKSLGICPSYSFIDENTGSYGYATTLNVCTDKDVHLLNAVEMKEIYSLNTMFFGEIPQEKPYTVLPTEYGAYYISEKGIYSTKYTARPDNNHLVLSSGKFGLREMVVGTEHDNYELYPQIVMAKNQVYCFDKFHKRFLMVDMMGSLNEFEEKENSVAPVNGIPHELKYLGSSQIGFKARGFAVFEDANIAQRSYFYFLKYDIMSYSNPILRVDTLDGDSPLTEADLYACNEKDAYLVYCLKNNKLYAYYVEDKMFRDMQPEELGAEEEITYMGHHYWTLETDGDNSFNYFVIATYFDGRYKIYLYNMLGGIPDGKPIRVLSGEGKVVGLQYVSPKQNQAHNSKLPLRLNLFH